MIPILDYLQKYTDSTPKKVGSVYFINSLFTFDKTPSCAIYEKTNSFFDYSAGFGGDVIELHRRINNLTRSEAFSDIIKGGLDLYTPPIKIMQHKPPNEEKQKTFEILSSDTIKYQRLINYSLSRGIHPDILKANCKELEYKINGYIFKAIAFYNDSGGVEVRNEKVKLSFNKKDITTIKNSDKKQTGIPEKQTVKNSDKKQMLKNLHIKNNLHIFEGFFDYLSYLQLIKMTRPKSKCIILNSVNMIDRVDTAGYDKVYTWFDNDEAGEKATKIISGIDMREKYKGFSDLNEYLMSI